MDAITIKRSILPDNSVASTINIEKLVINISSKFDNTVKLTDILFSVAAERLSNRCFSKGDTNTNLLYNFGEGNCHIDA